MDAKKLDNLFDNYYWDFNFQDALSQILAQSLGVRDAFVSTPLIRNKEGPSGIINVDKIQLQDTKNQVSEVVAARKTIVTEKDEHVLLNQQMIKDEYDSGIRFNKLRQYIPNFMYTYAVDIASQSLYSEFIKGLSVGKFFDSLQTTTSATFDIISSMVCQLAFSLQTMRHENLFHNDLTPENIIMRPCNTNVYIEYNHYKEGSQKGDAKKQSVFVPTFGYIATIIDFGNSSKKKENCNDETFSSGYDFVKFLLHLTNCLSATAKSTTGISSQLIDFRDSVLHALRTLGRFRFRKRDSLGLYNKGYASFNKQKEQRVDFEMLSSGRYSSLLGKCYPQKYNTELEYLYPGCQTHLVSKYTAVDLLSTMTIIDSNKFLITDVKKVQGPIVGCMMFPTDGIDRRRCPVYSKQYIQLSQMDKPVATPNTAGKIDQSRLSFGFIPRTNTEEERPVIRTSTYPIFKFKPDGSVSASPVIRRTSPLADISFAPMTAKTSAF